MKKLKNKFQKTFEKVENGKKIIRRNHVEEDRRRGRERKKKFKTNF